jgi:hypothetical protein
MHGYVLNVAGNETTMNKYIFFIGMGCLLTAVIGHLIVAFVLTG